MWINKDEWHGNEWIEGEEDDWNVFLVSRIPNSNLGVIISLPIMLHFFLHMFLLPLSYYPCYSMYIIPALHAQQRAEWKSFFGNRLKSLLSSVLFYCFPSISLNLMPLPHNRVPPSNYPFSHSTIQPGRMEQQKKNINCFMLIGKYGKIQFIMFFSNHPLMLNSWMIFPTT